MTYIGTQKKLERQKGTSSIIISRWLNTPCLKMWKAFTLNHDKITARWSFNQEAASPNKGKGGSLNTVQRITYLLKINHFSGQFLVQWLMMICFPSVFIAAITREKYRYEVFSFHIPQHIIHWVHSLTINFLHSTYL